MNAVSTVPRRGMPVLAAKLALLGIVSGGVSWALVNFADEWNLKFEYEGYGLELLPVGVYPGLVFGLLFGGFLRFAAGTSWPRTIGYLVASGVAYLAAFHTAFHLIATINDHGEVLTTIASGIPAGFVGSLVLGMLATFLLRIPARLALKAMKVPAVMVRVPDEFHGIRGRNSHYIAKIEHIIGWMEKYTK